MQREIYLLTQTISITIYQTDSILKIVTYIVFN